MAFNHILIGNGLYPLAISPRTFHMSRLASFQLDTPLATILFNSKIWKLFVSFCIPSLAAWTPEFSDSTMILPFVPHDAMDIWHMPVSMIPLVVGSTHIHERDGFIP